MEYGFDDNFYACKVKPLDKPLSGLNPPFQVSMEFVYRTNHYYVHVDSYTAEFDILDQFEENQCRIYRFCLCIFCEPSALYAVLSSLQIDPTEHRQIIDKILECGDSILSSSNDDEDKVFSFVVNITRTHIMYWFDKEYMVPATERSIKEVSEKLVRVVGDEEEGYDDHDVCSNNGRIEKKICENETCSVCLEKFCAGTYVCEMPCSHQFHQTCIVTWLKRSHYCPLCRYEMPTNLQNLLL